MKKFKIELELSAENERLLLENYEINKKESLGITFDEQLREGENDSYELTFSLFASEEVFGFDIERLISIGRPLWLTLDNDKKIRFIIRGFVKDTTPKGKRFDLQCQEYASFVFSRNNVGLTIDTFEEFYWDWLEYTSFPKKLGIKALGTWILERGWLKKAGEENGWLVEIIDSEESSDKLSQRQASFIISDSNTYNALIELAIAYRAHIYFDYENKKIIFIDREDEKLYNNYELNQKFNLTEKTITYSGDELYSLFYVMGSEDEFGMLSFLSDAVEYKDNFLFNFNYFKDKELLFDSNFIDSEESYETIDEKIFEELSDINTRFQKIIRERYHWLEQIRNYWSKINIASEIFFGAESAEDEKTKEVKHLELRNYFIERENDPRNIKTIKTRTPAISLTSLTSLDDIPYNFNIGAEFPFQVRYNSSNPWVDINEGSNQFGSGGIFAILLDPTEEQQQFSKKYWYMTPNGGIFPYWIMVTVPWEENFNPNLLEIKVQNYYYYLSITYNNNPYDFPFLDSLYIYDGIEEINKKANEIEMDINRTLENWKEDYNHLRCLLWLEDEEQSKTEDVVVDWTSVGPDLEEVCPLVYVPSQFGMLRALIEGLRENIKGYRHALGAYDVPPSEIDPESKLLGVKTYIWKLFLEAIDFYESTESAPDVIPVMETYRAIDKEKQNFWYNLKENQHHLFLEGYYNDAVETNAESLKMQASAKFEEHQLPNPEFNINYIDFSDILGVNLQEIKPGDFINIKDEYLKNLNIENSKLKVQEINRTLKNPGENSIIIYRYSLFNELLEKIIANNKSINKRGD